MINQPSWALIELDVCPSCSRDNWLFTHSLATTDNGFRDDESSWRKTSFVQCFNCHTYNLRSLINSASLSDDRELEARYLLENQVLMTDYPITLNTPKCFACQRPMAEASITNAAYADNRTIIVQVHKTCSVTPRCCRDTVLRMDMWEGRNSNLTNDNYCQMTTINRYDKCQVCLSQYLDERGETLEDDYFFCEACGSYRDTELETSFDGCSYCEPCYDNNVYTCSNCDEQYWGDEHDCRYDRDDYDDGVIYPYDHKPDPVFYGDDGKTRLFFGVELEVECRGNYSRHSSAEIVQDDLGDRVYLKSDGSLSNGFEIVTHPHTLDAFRTEFPWFKFLKFRTELGLRSWNTSTCGLHVHVSRAAFGVSYDNRTSVSLDDFDDFLRQRQAHEMRFVKLIYDNDRQVGKIAGRYSPEYANFADKGNVLNKVKYGHTEGGRHAAVNTFNSETLEVRVFKGSLIPETVISAIEFVHAGVEYTRNLQVNGKNKSLTWLAFSSYVYANMDNYPNLFRTMEKAFRSEQLYDSE